MPIEVKYWETRTGNNPVLEFIQDQKSLEAQDRIEKYIDRLRIMGLTLLRTAYVKKLTGYDLYELRIKVKRVLYRIIFVIKKSIAWLLVAFKKQGNKTPKQYLDLASSRASQV